MSWLTPIAAQYKQIHHWYQ